MPWEYRNPRHNSIVFFNNGIGFVLVVIPVYLIKWRKNPIAYKIRGIYLRIHVDHIYIAKFFHLAQCGMECNDFMTQNAKIGIFRFCEAFSEIFVLTFIYMYAVGNYTKQKVAYVGINMEL